MLGEQHNGPPGIHIPILYLFPITGPFKVFPTKLRQLLGTGKWLALVERYSPGSSPPSEMAKWATGLPWAAVCGAAAAGEAEAVTVAAC